MYLEPHFDKLQYILNSPPDAHAIISGSPSFPNVNGVVFFYQLTDGVTVIAQVNGLPQGAGTCPTNIFGFHIHEGSACTGNAEDVFANVGPHYNPKGCPHPAHAGDMPPLFGNHGYAFMVFVTDRFSVNDVIGRTVIIHSSPDDFTTQPSGNSGTKIACGQIIQNVR
ncbi:MAG TPA: superoxide dismutase family protein [Oscillospiraceae bacterium]|nr:superoxide dismutase family protein [Oscillospiraceae bacterium]